MFSYFVQVHTNSDMNHQNKKCLFLLAAVVKCFHVDQIIWVAIVCAQQHSHADGDDVNMLQVDKELVVINFDGYYPSESIMSFSIH